METTHAQAPERALDFRGLERPNPSLLSTASRLISAHPWLWLSVLIGVCLLPFVNKAFFTDDTLFLRAAEQIQKHPLDFYGFKINWFGYSSTMSAAFENPPLTSYYIAFVASWVGWSEPALHLAFLLPALAAAWGIFNLARLHCERPLLAATIAVLTPAFLVCATAVMCDIMLLALWVWCIVLFEHGLTTGERRAFLLSGVLGGLAFLTKFPGLSLVPLLGAYGLMRRRTLGWWMLAPTVPLLFVAGYECLTYFLYGHGHLFASADYASDFRTYAHDPLWEKVTIGFAFLGGCFLPMFFFGPLLWSRRFFLGGLCGLAACLLFVPRMSAWTTFLWKSGGMLDIPMFLFISSLVVCGASVFVLAVLDAWEKRDASSVLFLLWIGGVFVFTTAVNWTVNGRSLLPAVPALGILIARRLKRTRPGEVQVLPLRLVLPGIASAATALLLARSDVNLANTERTAAVQIFQAAHSGSNTVWFRGHSGYQYYFENLGARAL
ncbi:MAG TPA: glycosyltransferase family 39 protein, partial [Verrucomicrobiae bacterium]|nr:glycosyltransferase family 39 protein [Verrucomicrobiae bacterium]